MNFAFEDPTKESVGCLLNETENEKSGADYSVLCTIFPATVRKVRKRGRRLTGSYTIENTFLFSQGKFYIYYIYIDNVF